MEHGNDPLLRAQGFESDRTATCATTPKIEDQPIRIPTDQGCNSTLRYLDTELRDNEVQTQELQSNPVPSNPCSRVCQANKSSIRPTFRNGTVMSERPSPLNDDAIVALKFGGGLEAFHARYGDYYVAGDHLGADPALMLSEGATTSSTVEPLSVKVEVTVLWYEVSHTEGKFFTESSANSTFQRSAFDTLSNLHVSETRIGSESLKQPEENSERLVHGGEPVHQPGLVEDG